MQLLLIRHAIAEEREDYASTGKRDAERPLTPYGRRRMSRNARGLRRIAPKIDILVSSPYTRARETARIVAETLGIKSTEITETLIPEKHPKEFLAWVAGQPEDAVVAAVGHEPHLGRLLQWAIARQEESRVAFKKGGACLLEFDPSVKAGLAVLQWLVTPAQLRSIGE
ncbi:MAG: histidine phosphatase family protein [Gemmatimonadaceae bacterium]